MNLTQMIVGIAGGLLAFLFNYIPGFKTWFDRIEKNNDPDIANAKKQLIMLGLMVLSTLAIFGVVCAGWFSFIPVEISIECNEAGAVQLVWALIVGIAANQSTHRILPKAKSISLMLGR